MTNEEAVTRNDSIGEAGAPESAPVDLVENGSAAITPVNLEALEIEAVQFDADEVDTEIEPDEEIASEIEVEIEAEDELLEKQRLCERKIGYQFNDQDLLRSALTHASGAEHRLASNERLEFLGDSLLGAVVCELLFRQFPNYLEGDLTKIKSVVVSRQTCAKISEAIGLQRCLILGKGMATGPVPPSLLADVFESLVAALYLDGGDSASREFVEKYIAPEIELVAAGELGGNYKSLLQQFAQREFGSTPTYQLLDEKGPDHSKCFKIAAQVGRRRFAPAWGRNKKEAEQRSACNALSELNDEATPFSSD